jgi:hypothetical protein
LKKFDQVELIRNRGREGQWEKERFPVEVSERIEAGDPG